MFESMVEFAPDATLVCDGSGRIVLANGAACRMFGYAVEGMVGASIETLVPHRFREHHPAQRHAFRGHAASRPMSSRTPLWGLRKDGSEFRADISLATIPAGDGVRIVAAIRDITERIAAERAANEGAHRREVLTAMLESEESERARIAVSLHDDTVQAMTAALLGFDRLRSLAARGDTATAGTLAAGARLALSDATERARRLTFELRPVGLHKHGLRTALSALFGQAGSELGMRVSLDITPKRFGWAAEELVYRTMQEALSNIRKHAGAGKITASLRRAGDHLCGAITDDGGGFDTDSAAGIVGPLHIGIESMTERIRLAGGTLAIESQPGEGTCLRFTVPVTA
jgi:PAS domain S-box-containing protein